MELRIIDASVTAVVVKVEGEPGWKMRLSAPSMLEDNEEGEEPRDFIWYAMGLNAWHAIYGREHWQPLEDAWQAAKVNLQ